MVSIVEYVFDQAERTPDTAALLSEGQTTTYAELVGQAGRLGCALLSVAPPGGHQVVGIAAETSLSAHAGILSIWAAGAAYTPLNPHHPLSRRLELVERAGVDTLIVGPEALNDLDAFLSQAPRPLTLLLPELEHQTALRAAHPKHRLLFAPDLPPAPLPHAWRYVDPQALAYLLFTSGSTGTPKGVPITHANVGAYLEHARQAWPLQPGERVSRTFELTFDLSVHDLLTAWSSGATLVPLTRRDRLSPGRFILEHQLTRFFCVPTLAAAMARHGQLPPGGLGTLKSVLFCGEALPMGVARAFARAAPRAELFNLYGPTEATIAICARQLTPELLNQGEGSAPLGEPFAGHEAVVVDQEGQPQPTGEPGELWLRGPQVFAGYWKDDARSAEALAPGAFYRTGDRVVRDERGELRFVGRLDTQLKVRGHRIEPAEVEAALARALGHAQVACLPFPSEPRAADHLVALIAHPTELSPSAEQALRQRLLAELPAYMVPERLLALPTLPQNSNGKLDRRALALYLNTLRE
ncbi:hypothetical protein DL240_15600 [Lujinxingia litoralis]|uniref:AMP-dependent synthetase/ligase domain-containing protein n=1 Tax=Lujinxingia litoralis TaxID=2211119 RepID=A0A328C4R1_9DELT|nr:amino acid adenylation domain-containing protein [Lujinxingia litoralis]RAL20741.1 hypothetical protein DL240_15600 [Lujinxingia litoralis]